MKLQQLLKQKRFMDSVLNSFNKIGEPIGIDEFDYFTNADEFAEFFWDTCYPRMKNKLEPLELRNVMVFSWAIDVNSATL
jgi:hypothetical protein